MLKSLDRKLQSLGYITKLEPRLPLNNYFAEPDIVAWKANDLDGMLLVLDPTIVSDDRKITFETRVEEKVQKYGVPAVLDA